MNDQQPVTKAELLEALRELEGRLTTNISEQIHDTETRLLSAIHG